ncbi:hypothetical protein VNO77_22749 [Canavalia gladiata]|uniref:Uncharacterized protein n=1 Tax=Canavalia gladiata TaxID=3824 RepID=A0AAN9L363_CANGL
MLIMAILNDGTTVIKSSLGYSDDDNKVFISIFKHTKDEAKFCDNVLISIATRELHRAQEADMNWFGWFSYFLYDTDWMGCEVYSGKAGEDAYTTLSVC